MIGGDCGSEIALALGCSWWGTPPAAIGEGPSPAALFSSAIVPSNISLFQSLNHSHFFLPVATKHMGELCILMKQF